MGTPTPVYLTAANGVGFDRPAESGHDDYVSDPAKPVPFLPRPIDMNDADQWHGWLVHDQRFVDGRTDVLSYTSAPLTKAVHIMGAAERRPVRRHQRHRQRLGGEADRRLSERECRKMPSQGSKRDMSGFELPIGIEIFRGRYVDSFAKPHALQPGKVTEYDWTSRTSITCSCPATGSWCRCNRACFRSTTATRRPMFPTSSTRKLAIIARRRRASSRREQRERRLSADCAD